MMEQSHSARWGMLMTYLSIMALGAQGMALRFGDVVNFNHRDSNRYLYSHSVYLTGPKGSGQQEVTAFINDNNSRWIIAAPYPMLPTANDGQQLKLNEEFKLIHVTTGSPLHSHNTFAIALSSEKEVTGYKYRGKSPQTDYNDNWKVMEVRDQGDPAYDGAVKIQHIGTECVLASSRGISHYSIGHHQVECVKTRTNDQWFIPMYADDQSDDGGLEPNFPDTNFPDTNFPDTNLETETDDQSNNNDLKRNLLETNLEANTGICDLAREATRVMGKNPFEFDDVQETCDLLLVSTLDEIAVIVSAQAAIMGETYERPPDNEVLEGMAEVSTCCGQPYSGRGAISTTVSVAVIASAVAAMLF